MPLRILVLGASQGTGALVVREALARGHAVTAFARTPQKLNLTHPQLTLVTGDFHDAASVAAAVPGHDAVVITASATKLKAFKERPDYFSRGTRYAIDAMRASGVRRLVVLSALGAGETARLLPGPVRLLLRNFLLKVPFADHDVQEKLVMESGLDWVIARPGRLTDGPAKHRYVKRNELVRVPSAISRADVAHFLVDACEQVEWVGSGVQLGG